MENRRFPDELPDCARPGRFKQGGGALWRQQVSNRATEQRYINMYNRVQRNLAHTKYSTAFDIAQRYVWELAKVYDYETGLLSSDPQAGNQFLADIVATRSLGQEGISINSATTDGGLYDVVNRMKANWDVLKPRLGINNPDKPAKWFSLRRELFRIKEGADGDEAWKNELAKYRVDNLLANAEFARHCQPPAGENTVVFREPGYIIPFSTSINSAENFFGKTLQFGDHQFSSSDYAAKIDAVGVDLVVSRPGCLRSGRRCLIRGGQGGGSRMLGCVLEGNQTEGSGGGVYCDNSEIAGCELIGNSAKYGGGVFVTRGTFHNNFVSGNTASESGGGMRISSGFGHNCLVVGNEAREGAGVVMNYGELWNFTVVSNKAIESAGGVRLEGGTLGNTIIWGNESMDEEKNVSAFSSKSLNHCCWPEGEGEGHIAAAPQFAGDGDYHLRAGSPCVDAGETQDWMFGAEDWFDGQPRVSTREDDGGRVDIGADEAAEDAVGTPGTGKSSWTWRVVPDARLQLQRTTTLTSADWRDEGPAFTTTALGWCLDEPFAHPSPTFYRLLWLK